MRPILILTLFMLAACGADGAPTPPGVAVTGEVAVGVTNR